MPVHAELGVESFQILLVQLQHILNVDDLQQYDTPPHHITIKHIAAQLHTAPHRITSVLNTSIGPNATSRDNF